MNDLQLSVCLAVQLWLLFWDLLVIDHSVVLTQDETSLAFGDPQGSVTAHHECGSNRKEMAELQSRSNAGSWTKCVGRGTRESRWGSSGGNGGGKLILYLLCQRFLRFQVMTQHLVNAAVSRGCHARVLG